MLAYDLLGAADGPLAFVLHGILGSRRNWASLGRRLTEAHPRWRFALVDLRNHGDSTGLAPPHTVAACVADLAALAAQLGAPDAIIGHSFGGKVALAFGQAHGTRLLWALDSPPGPGDLESAHEIRRVIAAARALPQPVATRRAVVTHFVDLGVSEGIGRWMTTNITRADDGLRWRFDLDAIEAMLASYFEADLWPLLEAPGDAEVHVVRGGASDRWSAASAARLHALPAIHAHLLPGAGHWVHVDAPEALLALIGESLA